MADAPQHVPVHNLPMSYDFVEGLSSEGEKLVVLRLFTGTGAHHTFWTADEMIALGEKCIKKGNELKTAEGKLVIPRLRPPSFPDSWG